MGSRRQYWDMIVKCNHGIRDGAEDFVERYRWDETQDTWVPSGSGAVQRTYLYGNRRGWFGSADFTDTEADPMKHETGRRTHLHDKIHCLKKDCRKRWQGRVDTLEEAFTLMQVSSLRRREITLDELQIATRSVSSKHRG